MGTRCPASNFRKMMSSCPRSRPESSANSSLADMKSSEPRTCSRTASSVVASSSVTAAVWRPLPPPPPSGSPGTASSAQMLYTALNTTRRMATSTSKASDEEGDVATLRISGGGVSLCSSLLAWGESCHHCILSSVFVCHMQDSMPCARPDTKQCPRFQHLYTSHPPTPDPLTLCPHCISSPHTHSPFQDLQQPPHTAHLHKGFLALAVQNGAHMMTQGT